MSRVDDLWFLSSNANQRAAQAYHRLTDAYDGYIEHARTRTVSRDRFRTLATRIARCGAPYGAHTIVYQPCGKLLLCRHEGVDLWVLPGGEIDPGESFLEAARRELAEEAGVEATYDGLALVTKITVRCGGYETWGVLPVFAARAETTNPEVCDPDDEISDVKWFDAIPTDTRDREELVSWRERSLSV
ncbi:NUDIX hydrolase [Haladaptatus sp. DYSN1]|uniref:NUDIX hydrolase n=1 Tax=unclassified Haladaptatus TaxID=2622732 RepID=UPI002404EB1D|nr:NUDIX domain-containing protein [Haladaptatus sp. DYSN1]